MAMAPLILVLILHFLYIRTARTAECGPNNAKPVVLPIKDVLVDPSITESLMRGIPARIGSPPQPIVLLPWAELNNTWIYDGQHGCSAELALSDTTCRVRRGSYFRSTDSQSFRKSADIVAAGGSAIEITTLGTELDVGSLVSTSLGGTDVFSVGNGDEALVSSMPIGVPRLNWDHGYTTLHTLGFGSDSVYLRTLVKAGKIPSHVWSFFWGRTASPNQIDGSVVLGGYDREKVTGQNYTQRLDYSEATGCWTGMKVSISGIEANFWNGTNRNIIDKDQPVSVCIVPQRQHLLEAPVSVLTSFMAVTSMKSSKSSGGLQWADLVIDDGTTVFDGDITIVIASTLRIRIPNNQYIVPYVDFDSKGRRIVNNTQKVLAMSSTGNNPNTPTGNNPYTLGRWFFTGAVLMVDHDAGTFTLWQANPSTKSDLVAVIDPRAVQNKCNGGGAGGAGGESSSNQSSGGTNTAAIAGGAIGGAVILAVIVAVAIFLFRRKKKRAAATATATATAPPMTGMAEAQPFMYKGQSEPTVRQSELPGYVPMKLPSELSNDSSPQGYWPNGHMPAGGYAVYEMDGRGSR